MAKQNNQTKPVDNLNSTAEKTEEKKTVTGPFQQRFPIPYEFIILVNENYIDIHEAVLLSYVKSYRNQKKSIVKSQDILARSIGCSKRKLASMLSRLKSMGLLATTYKKYRYYVYLPSGFYNRVLFFLMEAYKNSVERLPDLSISKDRRYITVIEKQIETLASFVGADISEFFKNFEDVRKTIQEFETKNKFNKKSNNNMKNDDDEDEDEDEDEDGDEDNDEDDNDDDDGGDLDDDE